jgi:octaprenyl-diphosphate synthase
MSFGCAFQLIDDLLDLTSTEELMCKPVNSDVRAGVFTAPMLLGVEMANDPVSARRLMAEAMKDPAAAEDFRELVLATNAVGATLDLIGDYNERASNALAALPAGPTRDGLMALPKTYLDEIWAEKSVVL